MNQVEFYSVKSINWTTANYMFCNERVKSYVYYINTIVDFVLLLNADLLWAMFFGVFLQSGEVKK